MRNFMFAFLLACPCLLDAADSLNVHLVGYSDIPWISRDVVVSDPYAYIASFEGFYIMDISTPSNPDSIGCCICCKYMLGVAVAGSYAYVVSDDSGLTIIDISTLSTPAKISSCNTPGYACKVEIDGNYAYVADGNSGLRIIDVSTPSTPFEAAFMDTIGAVNNVTISNSYAYVCGNGLKIIDVSTPANPVKLGSCAGNALAVAVLDTLAYATAGNVLKIINVADSSNPIQISACTTSTGIWGYGGIAVSEPYAYIAVENGLNIVDISDPLNPTEVGYYQSILIGYTCDIKVSGQYIYLADSAGLHIFSNLLGIEEKGKESLKEISVLNNPVHCGHINVRLQVENANDLTLSLVDITGRQVKEFRLNGLNEGNIVRLPVNDVETGVYFITDGKYKNNRYGKVVIIK